MVWCLPHQSRWSRCRPMWSEGARIEHNLDIRQRGCKVRASFLLEGENYTSMRDRETSASLAKNIRFQIHQTSNSPTEARGISDRSRTSEGGSHRHSELQDRTVRLLFASSGPLHNWTRDESLAYENFRTNIISVNELVGGHMWIGSQSCSRMVMQAHAAQLWFIASFWTRAMVKFPRTRASFFACNDLTSLSWAHDK